MQYLPISLDVTRTPLSLDMAICIAWFCPKYSMDLFTNFAMAVSSLSPKKNTNLELQNYAHFCRFMNLYNLCIKNCFNFILLLRIKTQYAENI